MASPYLLDNYQLQHVNMAGQAFTVYLAFLNPVAITTNWVDVGLDAQGNALPPPNVDTAALRVAPYAPVANLGPNRIGFANETLYFDASRSCQRFDLPVVTYTWSATGSPTIVLYANGSQASLTWAAPGIYSVTLGVTDRTGTVTQGTRQVMVYQDRQHALPGMIQLSGPQGDLASGGWTCQINTVNSQFTLFPPDALPIGTFQPAVLLCETQYEITPGNWANVTLGPFGSFNPGQYYRDPRVLFDGYIQTGSVHQDVDKDTLSFTMMSAQGILNFAQAHNLGYYNTTYTSIVGGVPTSCNPSSMGQGNLVGGLMTADVIQGILQYHSNILQYHDLHQWNAVIPTGPYNAAGPNAYYNLVYATLSVTEGTIWSNVQQLAQNEFGQAYVEHDGSIRIGPQANARGYEYWQNPQLLGPTLAGEFINFAQDLGYTVSSSLGGMPASLPALPALPMPVSFVHPWGHQQPVPPGGWVPFQPPVEDPLFVTQQQGLVGPPILCVFSDSPVTDPALYGPPAGTIPYLYPWTVANWPQDLAVYPTTFDIQENYTGKASLVKLIGTLALSTSLLTSWYPQSAFQITGPGNGNTTTTILPAGNWIIADQQFVLPDTTTTQNRALVSNYWWEMARRYYYAQNINYNVTVALPMATFAQLGDIVAVTRQAATLGPRWTEKPFYVDSISYSIDMTNRTWTTQYTLTEVTSAVLGPIAPPLAIASTG